MKIVRKNTAKGHYYIDQETGERVPGVTTILDSGLPKKALINWAGRQPPSSFAALAPLVCTSTDPGA